MAVVVDAETLLQNCYKAGLKVSADGKDLVVEGPYIPELLEQLRRHKPAVIEVLKQRYPSSLGQGSVEIIRKWAEDQDWPELPLAPGRKIAAGKENWGTVFQFLSLSPSAPAVYKQQLKLYQEICPAIARRASGEVWGQLMRTALEAWAARYDWPELEIPSNPPLVIKGQRAWKVLLQALDSEELSLDEQRDALRLLAELVGIL